MLSICVMNFVLYKSFCISIVKKNKNKKKRRKKRACVHTINFFETLFNNCHHRVQKFDTSLNDLDFLLRTSLNDLDFHLRTSLKTSLNVLKFHLIKDQFE